MLNYIESLLNGIAIENDFNIMFRGGVDFVDEDWRRKNFGVEITPFALVPNHFEQAQGGTIIDFRYSLYIMPFSDDRERINVILDELEKRLQLSTKIETFTITTTPINTTYGSDFSEGSGHGILRFEALMLFNGIATSNYNMIHDSELKFGENVIPLLSFKWQHGKTNYINIDSELDNANNVNNNIDTLVVETPLSPFNTYVLNLLNKKDTVNISKNLKLKVGDSTLIDKDYTFDTHILGSSISQNAMSVFLYFSPKKEIETIIINGQVVPITSKKIVLNVSSLPHDSFVSNTLSSIFMKRTVSYGFVISKDSDLQVVKDLGKDLIDGREKAPVYNVKFDYLGERYEKEMLLSSVEESDDSGTIKTIFVESGELSG